MFKLLFIFSIATVAIQTFFINNAFAERKDFKVFDVRKNLPLTENEPIHYDYYVSIGEDQGVAKGNILTVYRRVPVMDVYRNQNHEDMQIPVAKLKVIYSERTMSVGRVIKLANRDKIPVLQFNKVMTGDRVEVSALGHETDSQAFDTDAIKKNLPKKEARKVASVATATAVVAPVQPAEINTEVQSKP